MKKTLLTLAFILPFLTTVVCGQEETKTHKNEFGAQAGFTTGLGFSYRHWFNDFGLQISGIPIKGDEFFFGSIGGTALYTLKNTKYVRTYLYLGAHYIYSKDTYDAYEYNDYYDDITYSYEATTEIEEILNIGFGPGFSVGRIVEFNLQIGYGAYDILYEFNLFPTIETGLYYTF